MYHGCKVMVVKYISLNIGKLYKKDLKLKIS